MKLLPITKEQLEKGKYYYVKHREGGDETIALCDIETMKTDYENEFELVDCEPYPVFWIIGGEFHFDIDQFEGIWGPIEFELSK